jgi:hypothetical protein
MGEFVGVQVAVRVEGQVFLAYVEAVTNDRLVVSRPGHEELIPMSWGCLLHATGWRRP